MDGGRVSIRRVPGESVEVTADIFADGILEVRGRVSWRTVGERTWRSVPMKPVGNDRFLGVFLAPGPGEYEYRVEGWVDPYLTWRSVLERRVAAKSVGAVDLLEGAEILRTAARQVRGGARRRLVSAADEITQLAPRSLEDAIRIAEESWVGDLLASSPERGEVVRSPPTLRLEVDPPIAQHSAWYEVFPRSTSSVEGRAGTLRDLRSRLSYIAEMGFDVVYLPPIHPIGLTHRRGPNNASPAPEGAPGSPWAIGSAAGGHISIDPGLGTLEDFRATVREVRRLGLELALDLAYQCSPDHPWVREHPTWFHHLPDGSIRPAENPPKKYDDIVPIDFATKDWPALWTALKEVVDFWVGEGVRWFRVDNPHTKPFEFWRWLISSVHRTHPEVMFLAEAFTRPKVMYRLAKVGFTHSYTYFAWRTSRAELTQYFEELSREPVGEYFRPHLWPNTPDILTEQFQRGQRSVFQHRLVLAATLSAHYGIYGPAFERMVHTPLEPGKEEYRDSEKYEVHAWPSSGPTLAPEVRRLNGIRRAHPALRTRQGPAFHGMDNDRLLAYSRSTADRADVMLMLVNLDPESVQSGWTDLDLTALGVADGVPFIVHDLWTDARFTWQGRRNFVRLDPHVFPAHLLEVERPAQGAPDAPGRS